MSRIIKYLPEYLQKVTEFIEQDTTLTKQLDLIEDKIKTLQNNQFINFADSEALSRYETMLNIDTDLSIEKRRANILAKYQSNTNYTLAWLNTYLTSYFGELGYKVNVKDLVLSIAIFSNGLEPKTIKFILEDLRKKIPSNVELNIKEVEELEDNLYFGGYVRTSSILHVTRDFEEFKGDTINLYTGVYTRMIKVIKI